tara:strand:+ start:438 stop:683 length:246 start_codon:yes stop_codon:yes gene_type:complete
VIYPTEHYPAHDDILIEIAGHIADERGMDEEYKERDMTWNCKSAEEGFALFKKFQKVPHLSVLSLIRRKNDVDRCYPVLKE